MKTMCKDKYSFNKWLIDEKIKDKHIEAINLLFNYVEENSFDGIGFCFDRCNIYESKPVIYFFITDKVFTKNKFHSSIRSIENFEKEVDMPLLEAKIKKEYGLITDSLEIIVIMEDTMEEDINKNSGLNKAIEALSHVMYARKHLNQNKEYFEDKPDELATVVNFIEDNERIYNMESGFSEYQKKAHDIVVTIPTSKHIGKLTVGMLSRIVNQFQNIIDRMDDGKISADLRPVIGGLATSSSVLLIDIEFIDEGKNQKDKIEISNRIKRTIAAANKIHLNTDFDKKNIENVSKDFIKDIGVSPDRAYHIAKAFKDLAPAPGDDAQTVKIDMPFENVSIEYKEYDRKNISKIVNYLEKRKKAEENTTQVIRGELGLSSEWRNDKKHYFQIKPIEGGRKITIFYEASDVFDEKVKQSIGTDIKIRVSFHNGCWYLNNWLGA